jgi:hypothetical protein
VLEPQRAVGLDVEAEALGYSRDAEHGARARDVDGRHLAADLGPADAFALAADQAEEVKAPVGARGVIGDAAEGDRDFGYPAVGDDAAVGVPDGVPLHKKRRVVLDEEVRAGAQRVDLEGIAVAAGLLRVEVDADEVVLAELPVAGLDRGVDRGRIGVEGLHSEV